MLMIKLKKNIKDFKKNYKIPFELSKPTKSNFQFFHGFQ